MTQAEAPLIDLFIKHGIHTDLRSEFRAVINKGIRPSHRLKIRLETCTNYAECLNEILERFAEPIRRLSKLQTLSHWRVLMSEPPEVRPVVTATDFLGNTISVGDRVVYPVRRGSRMWMNKLTVRSVNDTPSGTTISGTNDSGRLIHVRNLLNCVVKN